jgi:hypothetical protein
MFLAIFTFLLSIAFLYDQITKGVLNRLDPHQAPKSRFELVPVGANSSPTRADGIEYAQSGRCSGGIANRRSIVFVHGLGSNPDTTWQAARRAEAANASQEAARDNDRSVNWVRDFLPEDLPPAIYRDVRMFFYNYDSYWKREAVHTRLAHDGNELLEHINGKIRVSEAVSIDDRLGPSIPLTTPALGAKPELGLRSTQLWRSSGQDGRLSDGFLKGGTDGRRHLFRLRRIETLNTWPNIPERSSSWGRRIVGPTLAHGDGGWHRRSGRLGRTHLSWRT